MTTTPSSRRAGLLILHGLLAAGLSAGAALAQGVGSSFSGLQVRNDQPIAIESNQLDVDNAKAMATFTGDVLVTQGETLMKTVKLLVFYAKAPEAAGGAKAEPASATTGAMPGGSSKIDRLEATGKVYIKSIDQIATSDRADIDMTKQVVVLTGNVVVSQGDNVATGCRMTIQMQTGAAQIQSQQCGDAAGGGGRVKMMLTPKQSGQSQ